MDATSALAGMPPGFTGETDATTAKMRAGARKAAQDFEAVFLTTMLECMFEGIKAEAPFGGGQAEGAHW